MSELLNVALAAEQSSSEDRRLMHPSHKAATSTVISLRNHMMSKMCAAAILCCGEGVSAQTIYKQLDAAGHMIFTDRPTPDGIVVPHAGISSQERGPVSPPRIATGARLDLAQALFSNSPMSSIQAATIDSNEATRRLSQARQNRQEGIEPRPGERADRAGPSAMNTRYLRRQQRLEREVVAAELRSHETSLVRSTLSKHEGKTAPVETAQR